MAISAPIEEPIVWKISKVENVSPLGINQLTFVQDHWDQYKDYIEKDQDGNVIGIWCDYFSQENIVPEEEKEPIITLHSEVTTSGTPPTIKIGGSYKTFTVTFYDGDKEIDYRIGNWKFAIRESETEIRTLDNPSELLSLKPVDGKMNQLKIKFNKTRLDESDEISNLDYLGKTLLVSFASEDGMISPQLEVSIINI